MDVKGKDEAKVDITTQTFACFDPALLTAYAPRSRFIDRDECPISRRVNIIPYPEFEEIIRYGEFELELELELESEPDDVFNAYQPASPEFSPFYESIPRLYDEIDEAQQNEWVDEPPPLSW